MALVEFANAGRARDIDLRDVLADHIEADENHACVAHARPDLRAQPAVTVGQGAALGASAGCVEGLAAIGFDNTEGLASIALFVVAARGHEAQARERLDAGIAALPKLKRPRLVKWVSELPLTATGKLQRRKLKDLYLGGAA